MKLPDAYRKVYDVIKAAAPGSLPVHAGPITRAAPIGPCVIVGVPTAVRSVGVCSWEFNVPVTVLPGSGDNDWMDPLLVGAQQVAEWLIAGGVGVTEPLPTTVDTGGPNPLPAIELQTAVAG